MEGGEAARVVLAALYLAGAPRSHNPPRSAWRSVGGQLRRSGAGLEGASACLREGGLWSEALALETPGLLAWAEHLVGRGGALTAESAGFPARWLLPGFSPPPALYLQGELPAAPFIGVVGSRCVTPTVERFAFGVGRQAAKLGFTVVSGGAAGCDRAAAAGAGAALEIWPCGLNQRRAASHVACVLSARAPDEPFSAAGAMERNALIYSAGLHTVVAHARLKQGGTWTGASEALRRKLCRLIVRQDDADAASRALCALGAEPLKTPLELAVALEAPPHQPGLFADAASV